MCFAVPSIRLFHRLVRRWGHGAHRDRHDHLFPGARGGRGCAEQGRPPPPGGELGPPTVGRTRTRRGGPPIGLRTPRLTLAWGYPLLLWLVLLGQLLLLLGR